MVPMKNVVIKKQFADSAKEPGIYRDNKLPGFCLKVTPAGKKVYEVRRKVKGSQKNVTVSIGMHGIITAEQARDFAQKIIMDMCSGFNPNELRRQKREQEANELAEKVSEDRAKSITIRTVFADYVQSRHLKTSTVAGYDKVLKRCLGDWLDRPMCEIAKDIVERRHRALSEEHPAQANQVMRVLRALFTYAEATYEDHKSAPIISANPVKRLSQIKAWNRIPRRQTVIKAHEIKAWYAAVMTLPNITIRDYLRLLLFTGLRKQEAATLLWRNVDFDGLTIKVEDTKNHEDHILPMSDLLYDLLDERRQNRKDIKPYVFPGDGNGGYLIEARKQMAEVTRLSGVSFTLHDIRRTFLTTAEGLDIPHYALKRLANHKTNADVTAGYIISDVDRLRDPMQRITDRIKQLAGIDAEDQIRAAVESLLVASVDSQ